MEESVVEYHFAPQELYILFAVAIACYAITAPRNPSSEFSRSAERLINSFLFLSWVPLALHYVVIIFRLPPVIFYRLPDVLIDPNELHEVSKYLAYYVHIIMVLTSLFWIMLLRRAGWMIRGRWKYKVCRNIHFPKRGSHQLPLVIF